MDALDGAIVFLSVHLDRWLRDAHPNFNLPMANRFAKVIKVFDWETEEGKLLLQAREKNGKWGKLDPLLFKYVLKIYYPELKIDKGKKAGTSGLSFEEVLPRCYPGTELTLFDPLPEWVLKDLLKEEKDSFKVAPKTDK